MVNDELNLQKRSCFVICPFGNQKGTEDEVEVWQEMANLDKHVFSVARDICREAGFEVKLTDARGFDESDAGTIRKKVVELIDQSDAVVMVMTNNKPNAFIELGWAMGLWRDPIILREAGYKPPPSDVNDVLAVQYESDSITGDTPERATEIGTELAARIIDQLGGAHYKKPFEDYFKPTKLAHGKVDVLGRFHNISPEEWSQQFYEAEEFITLASSAVQKPAKQEFFDRDGNEIDVRDLLLDRALQGVQVTIVMQHPDNYSIDHLRRSSIETGLNTAVNEINTSFRGWNSRRRTFERIRNDRKLDLPEKGFRVIQMQRRFLPFRASMTDKLLYYTLRFYTQKVNSGVCLVAKPDPTNKDKFNRPFFDQVRDELAFLIEQNAESSEKAYQEWRDSHEVKEA